MSKLYRLVSYKENRVLQLWQLNPIMFYIYFMDILVEFIQSLLQSIYIMVNTFFKFYFLSFLYEVQLIK